MDREAIVPASMQSIVTQRGYLPGLRVGPFLFIAGQVGRTPDLRVIDDPEAQFTACFESLREVLAAAGAGFDAIVDLTTFHVDMAAHWPVFRTVKNRLFPQATVPWTAIGVSALAASGLLLEVKAIAIVDAPPGAAVNQARA